MGALAIVALTLGTLCICSVSVQVQDQDKGRRTHQKHNRGNCDLYQGTWIHDQSSHPLYNATCPFILQTLNCQDNGRPDNLYLQYRWQPSACNLPRFRGKRILSKLRGKRIMFVGDSLSLNQWQSLACMLHSAAPKAKYSITRNGVLSTINLLAHNISIMFYRNAFLVDIAREKIGRVLKLGSIENGNDWRDNDILIFNSWHWWLHTGRKQPWDYIRDGNNTLKDMDRLVAYEKALRTWAKWVDASLDTTRTKVFFQGVSPDHTYSKEWGKQIVHSCKGETEPLLPTKYPAGPHPAEEVLERVLKEMSKPVHLLRITLLSQLRKDGHPSRYGLSGNRGNDCTHWCLPGVPDTWNILLYAALV